jgi:transcription elongation GreA/GreB family factor
MAYMSQEGYDKLIAELKQLESVERPKASAAIAEARDKGDLSENSEYDAAKDAQAMLEMKINNLKDTLRNAKIVDTSRLKNDTVQILSKVEMTNLKNKAKMTYTIVSESETNLLQRKRLLTEESNRCYLCDDPVCTKACKPGLDPGRLLRACKMDNLAGAILRAYQMEACRDCDGYPCEKAFLRGRTDRAISITQIVRQL